MKKKKTRRAAPATSTKRKAAVGAGFSPPASVSARRTNAHDSARLRKALRAIEKEIKENEPAVERMIARTRRRIPGFQLDPATRRAITIYYKALARLAKE